MWCFKRAAPLSITFWDLNLGNWISYWKGAGMNFNFLSGHRIEKFNALRSFWKKERWHPGPTLAWAVENLPVQFCPPQSLEQVVKWWQTSSFSWFSFFLPYVVHSRRREPSTILFIVQNQSTTTGEQSQTKSYSLARSTIQTTVTRV